MSINIRRNPNHREQAQAPEKDTPSLPYLPIHALYGALPTLSLHQVHAIGPVRVQLFACIIVHSSRPDQLPPEATLLNIAAERQSITNVLAIGLLDSQSRSH